MSSKLVLYLLSHDLEFVIYPNKLANLKKTKHEVEE